jgi:hypothetical protein
MPSKFLHSKLLLYDSIDGFIASFIFSVFDLKISFCDFGVGELKQS